MIDCPQRANHASLAIEGVPSLAPFSGKREDQIDVGRKIQFAAAELAESENDQPLALARFVARHAVAFGERALGELIRAGQARFGQRRRSGDGFLDRVQTVHVAPDQPHRFEAAIAADGVHRAGFVDAWRAA